MGTVMHPWWERQLFKIRIGKYRWGHLRRDVYEKLQRRYQGQRLPDAALEMLARAIHYDRINKITIITPTRDRLEALRQYALPSVLRQSFDRDKFEIIIVDNSSNDETWEYLQRAPLPSNVRCLRERRQGICRAINLALAAAQGDIITFAEDDLEVDPNWLSRIYSFHCSGQYLVGQGLVYDVTLKRILNEHDNPARERNFFDANMSYRREVFNFASFNDHMIYGYESYDLMTQIFTFWPGFNHYLDNVPVKHYRAISEYRSRSQEELNERGRKMEDRMYEYWYLDRHILQRNLGIGERFYPFRFWLRETLLALPELLFVYGNAVALLRLKLRVFRQLQNIRLVSGINKLHWNRRG